MTKLSKINKIIPYILSFVLPAAVIALAFCVVGIYPGGKYTPLILDLRTEQLAFYNFLNTANSGMNSLSYQSLGGLGGGVLDSLQMCCGPFLFVVSLFDVLDIPWVLWWIIVCMIGLCGLSEFIYLKNGFPSLHSDYRALLFSICYALMSTAVIYSVVPVWLWGLVFLPLICLGLDKIIDHNKYLLFAVIVTTAIIFNYIMAYILIIFSVLYFIYRVLILKLSFKQSLTLAARCFVCGMISCLLSAFSWLPAFLDLMYGKTTESRTVTYGLIRNPFSTFLQMLPMRYDGLLKHSLPFIYCGMLAFVFACVFFINKKISIREKIISCSILFVLYICLIIGSLDVVWMFFAEPNGYPSRYSFVISFILILLGSRGSETVRLSVKPVVKHIVKCFVLFIVILELCLNSVYLIRSIRDDVGPYSEYEEYTRVTDTMSVLESEYGIGEGVGRTVKNWRYTNDDGILFGYPDIDYFSSSYNSDVHSFLEKLGLNGQFHMIRSTGINPVLASVLGVDTFIQYGSPLNDYCSYQGTVDGLDVYHNDMSIPVAFAVNSGLSGDLYAFGDDPFENTNLMMKDFCGSPEVFEELPFERNSNIASVIPSDGKHLWMYASPNYDSSQDIHSDNDGSAYYVYYSGMPIGEYANSVSPYLVDLGVGVGERVDFGFDEGASFKNIYFASYNDEQANVTLSHLKERGAYNIQIAKKEMRFDIDLNADQDILVTLPYAKGFSIYVDGKKTEYSSYRNALILINASEGHHNIRIGYSAPGLVSGCLISLFSFGIIVFSYFMFNRKKTCEEKNYNKCSFSLHGKISASAVFSFIIPVIIATVAFFGCGIYPGSKITLLTYDLRGQTLPIYGYLSERGPGMDSLLYSMSGGLGGNFIGNLSYHISPFDIIYCFVPVRLIPDAILIITLIKIGLCGLFSYIFITKHKKYSASGMMAVTLSSCYALMSYVFMYLMVPVWLDAVMLLPLLALGLEKIIAGNNAPSFVLFLVICFMSNYYLAYMIVIALVIYFVFRSVEENFTFVLFRKRTLSFFLYGLLSAGLSSVLLLPTALDFVRGKLSDDEFRQVHFFVVNTLVRVLSKLLPLSYSNLGQNQAPNIYCGSLVVILCLLWFLIGKEKKKNKAAGLIVILLYMISFMLGPIDRVWHGFREPVGFSCRYSFTFVFFMICFAVRGYNALRDYKINISNGLRKCLPIILIIYVFTELTVNGSYLISKISEEYTYANRSEYDRYCNMMTGFVADIEADSDTYGRVSKNFNYSIMDGALYGYDGLDYFSSSYNSYVVDLLYKFGLDSTNNYIRDTGLTPPVASLLNVRYYISYWFDKSDIYDTFSSPNAYSIYRNENALPLAFVIDSSGEESSPLGNDPFANINYIYSELFGDRISDVFIEQSYKLEYVVPDSETPEDKLINLVFTPDDDAHYWFYREYAQSSFGMSGITPNDLVYLGYYLNGSYIGDYGFHTYRYCTDLGRLNAGEEYDLTLEPGSSYDGNISLCYYDPEAMKEIHDSVNGFEVVSIGPSGIVIRGTVPEESDILITLPYEDGYRVFLDGKKTTYGSYRNALMTIHADAGEHEILIKYCPPGLNAGIIVSLLSILIAGIIYFTKKKNDHK